MNKRLLSVIVMMLAILMPSQLLAESVAGDETGAEPYAVLSDSNTVLTFYYDDQKTARGGMDIGPFYGGNILGYPS